MMTMTGLVQGKSVLVTGAGSGIGRATALLLADEGAQVMITDINEAAGQETAKQVEAAGGTAHSITADIASPRDVLEAVRRTVAAFGRLDGAVNNAGIDPEADVSSPWEEEVYDKVTRVNGRGLFLCLKYELAQLLLQPNGGAIVNIGSVASFAGAPGRPGYVANKHAVIGLTRTAAIEYAARKIRVNAVCPGGTLTPLMEKDPRVIAFVEQNSPIRRLAAPREIAEAIVWLISDRSSYVNGHGLVVDGGVLAAV
jgi:NAD(P)-dependent dehydrogenase (short-subunit alcohol dehydrogenase family)